MLNSRLTNYLTGYVAMETSVLYMPSLYYFMCKFSALSLMNTKESLWDLAVKQNSASELENGGEKTLIFAGSKGAGKSTIIQRFLDRSEVIKETLALEYNFGRKSGRSLTKESCHVWELGGGTLFINLLDLHLGKKNTTLMLVVDLSAPETLWNTIETILTYVYKYHKKREDWKPMDNPRQSDECVTPFPMPLVLIGTKYDVFQSFDSEKKRLICRTLRCVAHSLYASLIFYCDKDPTLHKKLKDVLHYHSFGGSQWKGHCTDYDKPLLISAGNDSFEEIGFNKSSISNKTRALPLDAFKHIYTIMFPQVSESTNIPDDPVKDPNFKEPLIDSLRSQKDDELDRFLEERDQLRKYTSNVAF